MNIDKDQILQLLRSQGKNDQASQASSELPDQVDTDNPSTPRCCPSTAWTRTAWAASSAASESSDPLRHAGRRVTGRSAARDRLYARAPAEGRCPAGARPQSSSAKNQSRSSSGWGC